MVDNFDESLNLAYNLHVSGKLEEAKLKYENLLKIRPDDVNLLFLYAQLNISLKNWDNALDILLKIYNKNPLDDVKLNIAKVYFYKNDYDNAIKLLSEFSDFNKEAVILLAISYLKKNKYNEAITEYLKLIDKNCIDCSNLFNLSICYLKIQEYDNALKYALQVYNNNPNDYDINIHIASIYEFQGRNEEALPYLLTAIKQKNDVEVIYRIACIYKILGDVKTALDYFLDVLKLNPLHKNALFSIAFIWSKIDKNVALKAIQQLYSYFPNDKNVLINLYFAYERMMMYDECEKVAKKLVKISPDDYSSWDIYANALDQVYKYDEEEKAYLKSVELKKDNITSALGLACLYSQKGDVQKAKDLVKPYLNSDDVIWSYMHFMLKDKNFNEIKEYFYKIHTKILSKEEGENRARRMFYYLNVNKKFHVSEDLFAQIKKESNQKVFNPCEIFKNKQYKGEDLKNKKLLLYSLHGYGDVIMVTRYIREFQKFAPNLILRVPSSLETLFKFNFPDLTVINEDKELSEDEYDYTTPFFLLLYHLNVDLKNIIHSKGYLSVSDGDVKEKSEFDFMKTDKLKVGLFWQGNPVILRNRSIKLKRMSELFKTDKIQFYSFQISNIDFESDELKTHINMIDLAPYINSYNDTAAFLKNIDVLVTIDSSIAHLAGALGIKTYLLLPYHTEWRWFYDTDKTPWYDSVKIFKQKYPNDWEEVILRVKNELNV